MAQKDEWRIQKAVIEWYDYQYPPSHEYHHLLVYNQNGSVNLGKIKGAILKLMGVRAGIPDLTLYLARGGHNGLLVELKTEKGRITKDQSIFHKRLTNAGYAVEGSHGVDNSIALIKRYIAGQHIKEL